MTQKEAEAFLTEAKNKGIRPGLERITYLMELLGRPDKKLSFIHVTGTNGKGSVSRFLSSALIRSGYRVGTFNTPQLSCYEECYAVGGKTMSHAMFQKVTGQVKEASDRMAGEEIGEPTEFECMVAMAMLFFAEKKADPVILEVGMGGLGDATNFIETTLISVITAVSYDHMQYLGESLTEIATQKAGIIKAGSVCVTKKQAPEVLTVIRKTCEEKNAKLTVADTDTLTKVVFGLKTQSFVTKDKQKIQIHLAGTYQIENAYLAYTVLKELRTLGYKLDDEKVKEGFQNATWHGRFTLLDAKTNAYMDGAHNEDAAIRLKESIETYFTNRRIIYIMGMLKDKEYERVADILTGYASMVITVTPQNKRGLDKMELARAVMEAGHRNSIRAKEEGVKFGLLSPKVTAADSLTEAVEIAELLRGEDGIILAFGSLSYLGELTDIYNQRNKKNGRSK